MREQLLKIGARSDSICRPNCSPQLANCLINRYVLRHCCVVTHQANIIIPQFPLFFR
ncbi:DUF2655 domain-containing protein [Lonsdalea populi]|uniref:DUF2655 domain-containing protein n=1 Tax=Lonsdalea populi TaxID=1172565 RepID=A0A3N0U7F3_9GAMM|nr:DUF2655 domain-containing protein [Lonsdalea populi]ROH76520.1 DUF2655 domain-containing protein [Lonsdalea populi]ROH82156.1 DUF2655 domain-containing protein [Lonsdalea populi]